MGCCNSTETPPKPPSLHRTLSLSKQYASSSNSSVTKKFSSQIELLKSLNPVFDSSLQSIHTSTAAYAEALQNLNFYFSSKSLNEPFTIPESLVCPQCCLTYNVSPNTPKVLSCGHTLCSLCFEAQYAVGNLFHCPFTCAPRIQSPESLEINSDVLEKVMSIEKGLFCYKHVCVSKDFCVRCKQIVCEDCVNEHLKHGILNVDSQEFVVEVEKWQKALSEYEKKAKENREMIKKHKENFLEVQKKMHYVFEEHSNTVELGVKDVEIGLVEAADETRKNLEEFVKHANSCMPQKEINLYKDLVLQELEKAKEVRNRLDEMKVGEGLRELWKVELKKFNKVPEANFRPWESTLSNLQEKISDKFLLLALTSMKFA